MNEERIDFSAILGEPGPEREERTVRSVMAVVAGRTSPRADLAGAIVALGRPALLVAVLLLLAIRLGLPAAPALMVTPTVGTALGLPLAADQVIRGPQPATAQQLLLSLGGDIGGDR